MDPLEKKDPPSIALRGVKRIWSREPEYELHLIPTIAGRGR